jgi:hypothetical protein
MMAKHSVILVGENNIKLVSSLHMTKEMAQRMAAYRKRWAVNKLNYRDFVVVEGWPGKVGDEV